MDDTGNPAGPGYPEGRVLALKCPGMPQAATRAPMSRHRAVRNRAAAYCTRIRQRKFRRTHVTGPAHHQRPGQTVVRCRPSSGDLVNDRWRSMAATTSLAAGACTCQCARSLMIRATAASLMIRRTIHDPRHCRGVEWLGVDRPGRRPGRLSGSQLALPPSRPVRSGSAGWARAASKRARSCISRRAGGKGASRDHA